MNKVILTGRITKDLELRHTANNTAVCEYSIAVNRIGSEDADFINVITYGKQAEHLHQYMSKGSLIAVFGEMRIDSWEKDGKNHYKTYVLSNQIEFLEKKKEVNPATPVNPLENLETGHIKTETDTSNVFNITDDDLPF